MDITNEEALKKGIEFVLERKKKLHRIKIVLKKDEYEMFENEIMDMNIAEKGFEKVINLLEVCAGALEIGQGLVNVAPPIDQILDMLEYMTVKQILNLYKNSFKNLEPLFRVFENDLTMKEKFILYSSVESIKAEIGIPDNLPPEELRKELRKLEIGDIHKIVERINTLKEDLNL